MCHFRRHADGFPKRGVRVDGLADVYGIRTHLDGQGHLTDHVARVGADHAAAQRQSCAANSPGFLISDIIGDMTSTCRLIVDTNILVAATRNRLGPSFALVQLIRQKLVTMCCSPALFLEYEDVLKRPQQLEASGLLAMDVDAILNELAGLIEPVTTHYQWRPQLKDPADEMVLEAAANAHADAIVTYNPRNFQPAQRFGLAVLNPEQTFSRFNLQPTRS